MRGRVGSWARMNFRDFPVRSWERRPDMFSKNVPGFSRVSGLRIDVSGDRRVSSFADVAADTCLLGGVSWRGWSDGVPI